MHRFVLLVSLVALCTKASAQDDTIRTRIDSARASFDKDSEKLREEVIRFLDKEESRARKKGDLDEISSAKTLERLAYEVRSGKHDALIAILYAKAVKDRSQYAWPESLLPLVEEMVVS